VEARQLDELVLADNMYMHSGLYGFVSSMLHLADGFEYSVYVGK
jgi:hypothetical protein